MKQNINKYKKWFLLMLFVAYYSTSVLFMHFHYNNGRFFAHSHLLPISEQSVPHHHNSLAELWVAHDLGMIHISDVKLDSFQLQLFHTNVIKIAEHTVYPDYLTPIAGPLSLRAPPALV
ncbi:hypothetical protein M2459_003050 [Parabacteroides sp. PF5-5]|uniref:hypothetical protein n=1 Tax=unclassified Parabacteroides TaxID=2649774 RepID=UPI0024736C28|nr:MULTISPECIES: hypothetical protein [unclassified Parabacteroides]MDH6305839.1 hypothetical protein [Parabacteroides sp. PH5-39]MDH6317347.1 hypothetical protein [Parabacteroides sp. PF5-13]MDH6320555.1 hypothetical protein [Parabacteroides sp. PH5-13]MDH6324282.1 hypothetical protein [Parabacteroides sp. PH5-8]MDH6328479.1 hypothetical protein [Parabacteroides sp. PH5-41]